MLRILLPPNLAAAAPRDAIALQVELDLSVPPPPALVPGLAVLQRLGVPPQPVSLLQLRRAQLRELLTALAGEKVFFRGDRPRDPLPWNGLELPGVSEHLTEKAAPPPTPKPAPAARPARRAAPEPTPMTVDGSEHYLAITLPSRESVLHEPALELLRAHRFVLDPLSRKWWLRDRHKTLNFLATHLPELQERYGAEFTPNFTRNTAHLKPADITAEVSEKEGAYEVALSLQAGAATDAQIRAAVTAGRGYLEEGGAIYLLDPGRIAKVEAAHRALAGEPDAGLAAGRHRIPRARAAEVSDLLDDVAPHYRAPETWRARSAALHSLSALAPAPIPPEFTGTLRPYQQLGTAWLWHVYREELGGILADEMGLGKTPQALALLAAVHAAHRREPLPHLVVVPASLLENWRREAARFTPHLRVFTHHGTRRLAAADFAGHDLVLTSYGTLARDAALFESVRFGVIVADEAQHLRNRRTQAAQSLRMLQGRGRFLLTGTPLENSLDDLRSLFEFLMPGFIARPGPGLKREERDWHDERLRVQTAPFILRRTKGAVAPELPPRIEQVVWCEPTPEQAALYRRMQEDTERQLLDLAAAGASEAKLRFATLTQLLRLRQICCDPRLVEKVGRVIPNAPEAATGPKRRVKDNPPYPDAAARPRPGGDASPYPNSAKLEAFRELLAESIDEGHRMLVFSQFTSLLDLLQAELDAEEVPYCRLDGSMTPKARQAQVDRFQADDSVPVFLISLKAGGTGLNLTGADVVVHYDPWWNPAAEAQATDRAHRIGQTKVVTAYRLICAGTVEEKVLALQDAKRALLADVFEASDEAAAKLSLADLRELLR